MADQSSGGNPIDDKTRALKHRQLQLQIEQFKLDIFKREVRIDEMAVEIDREKETIEAMRGQLEEKEKEFTEASETESEEEN
ncbi:hypothetical protein LCGC14_1686190 [marine sediment metagenome]|uniref:Uncharacterized protein n=1 Tax=marine sediment metagenome TaxID=412755 RepID=A0A0F9HMJ3_9ZZZZ